MSEKEYIGDSVYIEILLFPDHDGYHLVLTTEDGIKTTNTIYLSEFVYQNLVDYVEGVCYED